MRSPSTTAAVAAALDGLAHARRRHGARLVASAIEHSVILETGTYAAAQAGDPALLATVPVDRVGRLDLSAWRAAVNTPGTAVAALQHANGEVGTIQPVEAALEACRESGVPLLVDGSASVGRVPAPAAYDLLVADAATVGGPPVGLLVSPERVPFSRSGRHREPEFGRADAPMWIPLALAAAEAWQQHRAVATADAEQAWAITARLRSAASQLVDVDVAGDGTQRLPHIVAFSALFADGETLVHELDRLGLAVASGSACTSSTLRPSHVLAAMGVLTHGNVRVTLPIAAVAPSRGADVDRLVAELPGLLARVRRQLGTDAL